MSDLVVVGAGSQGRYVIETARRSEGALRVCALVDVETGSMIGSTVNGVPVACGLEGLEKAFPPALFLAVVAYGDVPRKQALVARVRGLGYRFATVVSPAAYISDHVAIGEGAIVNPGVTILPNARIGAHAIVHSGTVIEHDNVIGDFANIGPGVSFGGRVVVEEGAIVYTGATVIPKVRIGAHAVVGAGAVVIRDVPPRVVVVGCPARPIEK